MEINMELTPILNSELRDPLYAQLYFYIKTEIENGRISAGKKLPSIRQLSLHLKVSKNTVETAYQQLLAEGYIESVPKSGMIVLELEEVESVKIPPIIHPMIIEKEHIKYDFQYGDIELEKFPYKVWKRYMNEAMDESNKSLFLYGEKEGEYELRSEISQYLYHGRGVACSPEQIVLTAGTQQAIILISQLLQLQGKSVAMENPGYDGVRSIFSLENCIVKPISIEKDGLDVDELSKSGAELAYVTPSHQFPLGMVMSIQKRMRLLNWAYETDSYIIEDDYDGEFRYIGQPITSLKSLDTGEKVIYLGTFSKSFLPAARLSYMVLPPALVSLYRDRFQSYSQSVSPIIQKAVYLFMKNGDFDRHIRRMRKIYHDKHKALLSELEKWMGGRVEIIGQRAGLHILLDVKDSKDEDFIQKAREKGIKVYPTRKFWLDEGRNPASFIMLGFGGLSVEEIGDGIRELSEAWFG
ncbi:PLP-dependent aminotransferase family protein [Cytobacillus sp. FJAT-54145]|uniref:PLP-dependent aminotransferase family protein n=1 Tax=Cytobacillus spartinae TaxID=3299023 RepID=A0ABW6K8Z1_9BACI